jgi:hypothetical protein
MPASRAQATDGEESVRNYLGHFVFVQSVDQKNAYHDGEYFCVSQFGKTMTLVKLEIGYGGHRARSAVIGVTHNVADSYRNDADARKFVEDQFHWAKAPQRGEKLNWIESVYSSAGSNARLVSRALDRLSPGITIPANTMSISAASIAVFDPVAALKKVIEHYRGRADRGSDGPTRRRDMIKVARDLEDIDVRLAELGIA